MINFMIVKEIKTKRLILRQWKDEDIEPLSKMNASKKMNGKRRQYSLVSGM